MDLRFCEMSRISAGKSFKGILFIHLWFLMGKTKHLFLMYKCCMLSPPKFRAVFLVWQNKTDGFSAESTGPNGKTVCWRIISSVCALCLPDCYMEVWRAWDCCWHHISQKELDTWLTGSVILLEPFQLKPRAAVPSELQPIEWQCKSGRADWHHTLVSISEPGAHTGLAWQEHKKHICVLYLVDIISYPC